MTERTHNTKGVECPYCNFVIDPDEEFFFMDDRVQFECGNCLKLFSFTYFRRDSWTGIPLNETDHDDQEHERA